MVIMFVVTVNVVRTEKQLKALLLLILVATCILSLSAINDYRLGNLVLKGLRIKGAIGGLFENPNDLGAALCYIFSNRTCSCLVVAVSGLKANIFTRPPRLHSVERSSLSPAADFSG